MVIEVTAFDGTRSSTHTFNLIVLPDKDQDGVADEDDLDDDNDGILDTVEGTDMTETVFLMMMLMEMV